MASCIHYPVHYLVNWLVASYLGRGKVQLMLTKHGRIVTIICQIWRNCRSLWISQQWRQWRVNYCLFHPLINWFIKSGIYDHQFQLNHAYSCWSWSKLFVFVRCPLCPLCPSSNNSKLLHVSNVPISLGMALNWVLSKAWLMVEFWSLWNCIHLVVPTGLIEMAKTSLTFGVHM